MPTRDNAGWRWATVCAALGALAVALGAFGAHGLEDAVTARRLQTWETAASYHGLHALAGLAAGVVVALTGSPLSLWAARLFVLGIVVFSGSLYTLVLTDTAMLGAITPLGGVAFIAGWLVLAFALWRQQSGER
ncbi:MAG: DUF423 domain-containing protein [Bacteroidota bacterium]